MTSLLQKLRRRWVAFTVLITLLTQTLSPTLAFSKHLSLIAEAEDPPITAISIQTQLTIGLLSNKGDPAKAIKTLGDKDFLKSFAINVISAGITQGVCNQLEIAPPTATQVQKMSFPELLTTQLKYQLISAAVSDAFRVTVGEEKLKDVLILSLSRRISRSQYEQIAKNGPQCYESYQGKCILCFYE